MNLTDTITLSSVKIFRTPCRVKCVTDEWAEWVINGVTYDNHKTRGYWGDEQWRASQTVYSRYLEVVKDHVMSLKQDGFVPYHVSFCSGFWQVTGRWYSKERWEQYQRDANEKLEQAQRNTAV